MKKSLAILIVVLTITMATTLVLARNLPAITAVNKVSYKSMLQSYFHPVLHGYGIGFNESNYITAKWHIVNVRILAKNQIREIVSNSNSTDWSQLRAEIQTALQNQGTEIKKGRIRIGNTDYVLTNILVSNETATADIREMPVYATCVQQNISAEDCESNATKVGDFSLTKKIEAFEDNRTDPRVWAGIMNFKGVQYTFVTFAYPRW